MNRLALVNRVMSEAGVTGLGINTTGGQRGEALNFINWVDDAWLEIQGLRNWPSMWEQVSIAFVQGANITAQSVAHARYDLESAKIAGAELAYLTWDEFKRTYPVVIAGTPSAWTVRPDRSIALNAIAQAPLAMTVERYKQPKRFEVDTEEPTLFAEHHMMIAWRALMFYGGYDEAGVAYKRGEAEYRKLKNLAAMDAPALRQGEPLL